MDGNRARPGSSGLEKTLRGLLGAAPAMGLAMFFVAVLLSGRLGVEMARNRIPEKSVQMPPPSMEPLSLGSPSDPVYLARDAESLRRFFATYPSAEARSEANLVGLGIRRIFDRIDATVEGIEADALRVRVDSGSLTDTVHWVHHSQVLSPLPFDPVISPLPVEPGNR